MTDTRRDVLEFASAALAAVGWLVISLGWLFAMGTLIMSSNGFDAIAWLVPVAILAAGAASIWGGRRIRKRLVRRSR